MNSLGFEKPPAGTRAIVAMSGGVDSSVAAALLADEGYDVVGITLRLYDQGEPAKGARTCCAGRDIYDARRVADHLAIPHYVLDYQGRFREGVIEDFADSYVRGETPVPCVRCNQTVKFRDLLATAKDLGGDVLVTGHYVRRVMGPAGPELHRGADPVRDQSYFLFATTAEQLACLRFPLGPLSKDETRALARRFDLPVSEKPASQDICFVAGGRYADVVARLRPGALDEGDIVDLEGRVLGRHRGIIHFTVGQRRGLRLSSPEALYVVRIEPAMRRVVVGPRAALREARVRVAEVNWLAPGGVPTDGRKVSVKLRSSQSAAAATVTARGGGEAEVVLDEAGEAIAPGQACVFYEGERVLGGGWIKRPVEGAEARRVA